VVLVRGKTREEIFIEHPKHVQLPHVENMKKQLLEKGGYLHPSSGQTALHTSWIMEEIMAQ
jgi:hypothetical protein